jgi:HK97 gp10 family phage protein
MADGFNITIKGLNELGQRLQIFSNKIANEVTLEGVKEGAMIFRDEAIGNVPPNRRGTYHWLKVKGEYVKIWPGNLAKNIFIKRAKKMPSGTIRYEVFLRKHHAWYGLFVERGRSNMAANPFMARAFEAKRFEVYEALKARIQRALREGGR